MNDIKHSAMQKGVMLDWLRACEEEGRHFPSDEEIQGRFGFASVEMARTLLADLADAGKIRISGTGPGRQITLAGPARHACASAKPGRSVKKPERADAQVDRAVSKIMSIVRNGRQPPTANPASRPNKAPALARRGQVNIRLTEQVEDAFHARILPDESYSGAARRIFEAALAEPVPTASVTSLERKPVVSVAVLHAAIAAGEDIHRFVARLIDLGLAAHLAGLPEREQAA